MSNYIRLSVALLLTLFVSVGSLAISKSPAHRPPNVAPQSLLDTDILSMVALVDSNRISADIQTLVGFGTRNTCSDNSGASPGIGAARNWIQSQFAALPGL